MPLYKSQAAPLAAKADLASPALTGTPTAPTPTAGDNDTSIATTAFVVTGRTRGCIAKKAADETGANYTTQAAVPWTSEEYDTDSIHDNSSNNSRVTVPAGASWVRVSSNLRISGNTADTWLFYALAKNGSTEFVGGGGITTETGLTTGRLNVYTPIIAVTPGDYFEGLLQVESDTAINIEAESSWLAMEIIA